MALNDSSISSDPSEPAEPFRHEGESESRIPSASVKLREFAERSWSDFPWKVVFSDWTGQRYALGEGRDHWRGTDLEIIANTERAARSMFQMNPLQSLELCVAGELEIKGNFYLIYELNQHIGGKIHPLQALGSILRNSAFQSMSNAKVNVKSHYDVPQVAINLYLDRKYLSYSCGMFEEPDQLRLSDLTTVGKGKEDEFDSLEKSQWRKFKDAADYINPNDGETLLDIGCGYGGQIAVALEDHPFSNVVGWTHSANQALLGKNQILRDFDPSRWELHEGDYREDTRIFDHITSTGMVSHIGPRGLGSYVKNVRKRIKTEGRYVHHALMTPHRTRFHDFNIGRVFNKKYVWPGFHWFTVGAHVKALESNGFEVHRMVNLSQHYAKTTASWYERMMENEEEILKSFGGETFRAWQIFLAGITSSYLNKGSHIYRIYCVAV